MPLSLQFALRELRGGLRGFGVFLACIVLGVAAIASVGSLRGAIMQGIAENGQLILGGDIELRLTNLPIDKDARAYLESKGEVSQTITLRGMARSETTAKRSLMELKAVDGIYPLYGEVTVKEGNGLEALGQQNGVWGALIDEGIFERLGSHMGDRLAIGDQIFEIRGLIAREPDRSADGFTLGARIMVALEAMESTGLIRPGSLMRYNYRVALDGDVSPADVRAALGEKYPDAGWRIRDRDNSAPSVRDFMNRLSVFLSLAGLTTLVVGGVGIANATAGFLATKREAIATLKCMGATGGAIFRIYLSQIMIIALAGVAAGLALGAVVPFFLLEYLRDMLPVPAEAGVYGQPLALAAAYGLVTVIAFAAWPLGKARDIPAAGLFRQIVAPAAGVPKARYLALVSGAVITLALLALFFSGHQMFAGWFLIGAIGSFVALLVTGRLIMKLASMAPRPKNSAWRMALANLHRPGTATPNIVLSLGLGLTLLVTIAQIEGNLSSQITDAMPEEAPSFFFIDVQSDQIDAFEALLTAQPGVARLNRAPMLRAAILRINDVPVDKATVAPEAQWAIRGDRGLTYMAQPPAGTEIVEGEWWPEDYAGPPLISFDEQLARGMGLGIGDSLTFNVLGRRIEATIGNIRRINWSTMGMNFSIIFAPGTLEKAPHAHLASLVVDPAQETAIEAVVAANFPNVTAVRLREALKTVNSLIADIGLAIRGAASAALIAGLLVLAGAVAAGFHERVHDSVILKVLGATRRQVGLVYVMEYALMGLVTALAAMALGTLAAWLVMTEIMGAQWVWQPAVLVLTALGGMAVTVLFGFVGTWRALGAKAAPVLRTE